MPEDAFQRQRFNQESDAPAQAAHARMVLRLLLAQDGSTTRLCEAVAAGPVLLCLLEQRVVQDVPPEVRAALPGESFIERVTSLASHGQVMMDNLSYIALEGLPDGLRSDLEQGELPIGHLLAKMWAKRVFVDAPGCQARLWERVGLADAQATRTYCVATPQGPCMLISETFRRGMLRA